MDVASPHPARFARTAAVTLAVLGVAVCVGLQVLHVRTYLAPTADSFCRTGASFDCNAVTLSRFSVVLGVPLPAWGALGFYAMAVAAWRRSKLLLWLAAIAAAASIALFVEEVAVISAICMLCEAVHLLALVLLVVAWRGRSALRDPSRPDILAAVFGPALVWIGLRLFVSPYWVAVLWISGVPFPHGVDADGFPWIGAENPKVVVHEYTDYGCPHCAVGTGRMRQLLAQHVDEIRIVRHQQPRLRCHEGAMSGCIALRVAICGGDLGKFWEMDSWLFAHGRPGNDVELELAASEVGVDLAALQACVNDVATQHRAAAYAAEARAAKISGTPGYIIDGERLEPKDVGSAINSRL